MLATAIIVFREILEIALIVGLVLAATRGVVGRGVWVAGGMGVGVLGAIILAFFADYISDAAEGMGQEIMNAGILFTAVVMLGWHNVWMRKHASELASKINNVSRLIVSGEKPMYVLAVIAGLATLREGAEIVLFLSGIVAGGASAWSMLGGGVLGLGAGVVIGLVLFFGLLRIPVKHLFTVSGWLILLLAAGMASHGAGYLIQADVLPAMGHALWDSSHILSEQSLVGQILHTLIGYVSRPSGMQLVFYGATILVIGSLMLAAGNKPIDIKKRMATPAIITALLIGLVFLAAPEVNAAHKIYSPIVEKGEFEVEIRGHRDRDSDFDNNGKSKYKVEFGYGVTDRWFTAIGAEYENDIGSDWKREATYWENIIQLTDQGKYWLDAGIYVEYEAATERGHADKIEVKGLLEKSVKKWTHTANVILEKEVGPNRNGDTEFEFAWRSKYRLSPLFEPGFEFWWEPGELENFKPSDRQEMQLGPVIYGTSKIGKKSKIGYEFGYLKGLTRETPDSTIKLVFEYEVVF
jgi:FTR1 family protein